MNDIHHHELQDAKELDEAYKWFDLRDHKHFQCCFRINEALHCVETETSDKLSLVSSKSSKRSSSSSVRFRRAKAAAMTACL